MDLGVEDRDALPVGGEVVDVGAGSALDQAVEAEPGEVVARLVAGVVIEGGAEQMAHLGAEAPVGESEGVQADAEGAQQGHDARISEP